MYDPSYFIRSCSDVKHEDIEDILKRDNSIIWEADTLKEFANDMLFYDIDQNVPKLFSSLRKKHRISPRHSDVIHTLDTFFASHEKYKVWRKKLVTTKTRSKSGVVVITVVTSPYPEANGVAQKFSCKWNCYYCPNEPNQPRSYLHDEPAVIRANINNFDPVLQFFDRAKALQDKGHDIDKIELLVLGGTWESYPMEYRKSFCRDLFYAANEFGDRTCDAREKLSLQEEKELNEDATCRIIGLTLETRPDTIDEESIKSLREVGCTRVQLGVQHTDDDILKKMNRKCSTGDTIHAFKLLKNACFKIDIHLMPNLPGSNASTDLRMFDRVLNDEDLQADQWKIYPCEVVPWTVIEKWYQSGEYIPYNNDELLEVLILAKSKVHPWIRLNRVVRDIPSQYIFNKNIPNLRNTLEEKMKNRGLKCSCIRCREPGNNYFNINNFHLKIRKYRSSGSVEFFLSYEYEDVIAAFLRLRLPVEYTFDSMQGMAFIRELHVYGSTTPVMKQNFHIQHAGLGKALLRYAELISLLNGYLKIAVISGVGTRNYYRKRGYVHMDENEYLIKNFHFIFYKCVWLLISIIFASYSCWRAVIVQ